MAYTYDDQNIFARILRGEIPNDTVAENDHALAFNDIQPQAPVHILIIPKGPYVTYDHFCAEASEAEIAGFARLCCEVTARLAPGSGGNGYRAISNAGPDGVQEVPHYHLHILGGRMMGPMVKRAD